MKRSRPVKALSPVLFISGPFSAENWAGIELNIARADDAARNIIAYALRALGMPVRVLTPHILTGHWYSDPRFQDTYEYFMDMYADWIIDTADVLYRLGPSPGADREMALALSLGIPVLESQEAVIEWLEQWADQAKAAARFPEPAASSS